MRNLYWIPITLALLAAPAWSQVPLPEMRENSDGRVWVEGFLSRHDVVSSGGRSRLPTAGGRVTWLLGGEPPEDATVAQRLAHRVAVGAFYSGTLGELGSRQLRHIGVQADVRPFADPIFGRFEPLLATGAGRLRLVEGDRAISGRSLRVGIGARLAIVPGLVLRGDVARVSLSAPIVRHATELAAGLSWAR